METPFLGKKAPDFALPDQDGNKHTLSGYRGKWVLLYFYPRDNTIGCTIEACAIRDRFTRFRERNAVVLGVSTDAVGRHKKFEEKHRLPFTLLSDEGKEVVARYGVWAKKTFLGRAYMGTLRKSFLIDPRGTIVKIYEKVKPSMHAEEVLKDLDELTPLKIR